MYLSNLTIEGFRIFGTKELGTHLDLDFRYGLNVLIGENDSGKSAIVDAIRFTLLTTSYEYHRLVEDDFHVNGSGRLEKLSICCRFSGLTTNDAGRFLDHVSHGVDGNPELSVTLKASLRDVVKQGIVVGKKVFSTTNSGVNGDGPAITGEIREFLRGTYLRPLRDAEAELDASRGSRLSQILQSHPLFGQQRDNDFDPSEPGKPPKTLVGIVRRAEHGIDSNPVILKATDQLNNDYLSRFAIAEDSLSGSIGVAKSSELRQILESLRLRFRCLPGISEETRRGLGVNNVLFMSTELLLLNESADDDVNPLLLIEEPEAHLHPQMQVRLMDFLKEKCQRKHSDVQVILTTHSPNLAADAPLECMTIMKLGQAFPLSPRHTRLKAADYRFLSRFLDVTKSNLFFAKGVLIVEGDAEQILLPVLAELIGFSLSKFGVSIVNVGSVGLFRYSRIFQRTDGKTLQTRVACIADNDLPSAAAEYVEVPKKKKKFWSDFTPEERAARVAKLKSNDCQSVQTFVSPMWTLEHDLGLTPCARYLYIAVCFAKKTARLSDDLRPSEIRELLHGANEQYQSWIDAQQSAEWIAAKIYEDLFKRYVSKTQVAQIFGELLRRVKPRPPRSELISWLPEYLVDAIRYVTGNAPSEDLT